MLEISKSKFTNKLRTIVMVKSSFFQQMFIENFINLAL